MSSALPGIALGMDPGPKGGRAGAYPYRFHFARGIRAKIGAD
ncbi:MAG TPA: hypothetical protein VK673_18595 [Chthoniobacterales bacterium]|nr:hypothetical protein [Chthoniobacterales bacterium]